MHTYRRRRTHHASLVEEIGAVVNSPRRHTRFRASLLRRLAPYELDENDYRDVSALCERFGLALPAEYESFTRDGAE
jgi:hypothetical protein